MKKAILSIVLAGLGGLLQAQPISIIPQPARIIQPKIAGKLLLSSETPVVLKGRGLENSWNFLHDYVKEYYGIELKRSHAAKNSKAIYLGYEKMNYPVKGAYRMQVKADGVHINGDNENGVFYGVQTLLQLLPAEKDKPFSLPYVNIEDYPRFAYRGLHLDVGRHFFGVDFIKKYIDYIALHKLNYFHWHLTEDQGWRIEIKRYPELTRKGAWRNGTIIGHYPGTGNDNEPTGGFYTQEQVKDIVAYAARRYVTIIPEIEMPGHASAAIASYPYLSCFPQEKTVIADNAISDASRKQGGKLVQETWGVFNDVFCAGKDSVFDFIENVLDEIIPLFPSQYIHVGGDECPKTNWKRCPNCQRRMQQLGLKTEHELQSYFIQRVEKYINSKGKKLIGWDEILEGGLAPNAIVMSWRGEQGGIEAAKQHHEVIMTPGSHLYFDHGQFKPEDSLTIGGYLPLDKVYSYEPVAAALSPEQGKYILGAQANMWTEYMSNTAKVEYMLFPRIAALSEMLWTPRDRRNWSDFQQRLPEQLKRYQLWDVNMSPTYLKEYKLAAANAEAGKHEVPATTGASR